ncbi:pyrrolidone-carboxylate peptidase [Staphylothermus hellenicus]|uniref:Pyrrolidone-carboxylate peptidase (N-terminal pyroglutamyl peptidase)-like protein n=1 Tax=Staphylothermus hellenicus (strain DSM 12710 / JCM 10830 / BK20S6-10-b1 / P8) TaxID=591019 RepID=D7DAQ6_STAHD|nr:pyrrolidone-carboxylate peptidase [Staphylothermus hellenicus]ADI31253.1 Pyrrolidone-carboxylate peptidase (N-terminal pyroglutamyl peptidase)-like protein [Staphylothermus hellenicus DSM 12710]
MGDCWFIVSGFDWYRGRGGWVLYYPNPSGIVASLLDGEVVGGCGVRGVVLDVDYPSIEKLDKILEKLKPVGVVGLGLHPLTTVPLLEASAVNVRFENREDERNASKLYSDSPLCISVQIELFDLLKYLWSKGYDVAPSNTAGLYLCNAVAYTIYRFASKHNSKALFIHVPPVGVLKHRLSRTYVNMWSIDLLKQLVIDVLKYMVKNK